MTYQSELSPRLRGKERRLEREFERQIDKATSWERLTEICESIDRGFKGGQIPIVLADCLLDRVRVQARIIQHEQKAVE